MYCQAQRLLVKYAKNLGKTEVFAIIYSCQSSKSVQRYSTRCIILWKNNVFPRRRLRTLACIEFGVYLAPFGRVWASKLGPCWDRLGLHWTSSCDFWCLLGDLGALHWFWTWIGIDYRAMATKNAVLEASRLDFGALRPWFWRVWGGGEPYFWDDFLHNLLLSKFKISSTWLAILH